MKKVLVLLMVAGMFSLVACGPTEEEKKAAEAEAAAMVEEMMGGLEDAMEEEPAAEEEMALAVHECDATCEENGCTGPRCGEEGHECTEACHAEHDHAEGEEHSEEEAH